MTAAESSTNTAAVAAHSVVLDICLPLSTGELRAGAAAPE
jgi:hypothetical protein